MTGRFIKRNRNTPIRRKMKKEEKKICKFRRKSLYNFTILGNSSIQDFMRLKDIDFVGLVLKIRSIVTIKVDLI